MFLFCMYSVLFEVSCLLNLLFRRFGGVFCLFFFFFKQKTAYELRISDWSSDVCSSDLGGLKVKRRAPQIAADIRNRHEANLTDPLAMMDWINLWAMAVNEENAAGGKVVTAPTNGAAGIIPAEIGRAPCRERV